MKLCNYMDKEHMKTNKFKEDEKRTSQKKKKSTSK